MPSEVLSAYSVAGLTLRSEVRLPELGPAAGTAEADWTFRVTRARSRQPLSGWFHHWRNDDGPWLSFGRDGDGYVLRFARLTTFRVAPAQRTILCEGATRVPRKTVRHLFLNQV